MDHLSCLQEVNDGVVGALRIRRQLHASAELNAEIERRYGEGNQRSFLAASIAAAASARTRWGSAAVLLGTAKVFFFSSSYSDTAWIGNRRHRLVIECANSLFHHASEDSDGLLPALHLSVRCTRL
jgi:hypothetical protein